MTWAIACIECARVHACIFVYITVAVTTANWRTVIGSGAERELVCQRVSNMLLVNASECTIQDIASSILSLRCSNPAAFSTDQLEDEFQQVKVWLHAREWYGITNAFKMNAL